MARRPRPTSRRPPKRQLGEAAWSGKKSSAQETRAVRPKAKPSKLPPPESDDENEEESDEEQVDDDHEDEEGAESDVEEETDADAPRVAQWVDEDELDLEAEDEDEEFEESEGEGSNNDAGPSNLRALQDDLSSLPLGTLRKAQKALAQAKTDSDSEDEDDDDDSEDEDSAPEVSHSRVDPKGKSREERSKPDVQKRKHKHAPTEVSSKRPPRRRLGGEKKETRDPRFLSVTGEYSAERFRAQYGFLSDMHQDEMKTLKENLKKARKMLASSPRDLRSEREQEVQKLERAVKRAESTVNKDRMDKIEQSALKRARQDEREKQKQGKGAWFMKDADKRELVTRAKFDALAESGGRGAVKKAIEKKQKKVAQKEKKKRPFAPGGPGGKRPLPARMADSRPHKRQRLSS